MYIKVYTKDWNNVESDNLHIQYSYDKHDWYCFNGNNAVLFCSFGEKRIKNPKLLKGADEFFLVAELVGSDKLVLFNSKDLINYTAERIVSATTINLEPFSDIIEVEDDIIIPMKKIWGAPEPVDKMKEKYFNPLIMHRADPFIYKHIDGYYYFTASYTDMEHNLESKYQYDRIIIRKAKTINGLSDNSSEYSERVVFKKEPVNSGTQSPHVWAPEIHYIDGAWYIYYTTTILPDNKWAIRPHVLECKAQDPFEGEWVDLGRVQKENPNDIAFEDFSLDHTSFEHKGTRYLLWAQKGTTGNSDIFIAKMKNPYTICTNAVMITTPQYNWEKHGFSVNEGPSILKRNGKIFMVFSASGTDALYCLGMLTADENADLLSPNSWTKTPYPVFQSSRENGQFGPGHNSFTVSEDGNDDLLVYHARQEERYLVEPNYQPLYDAGRNTSVAKIYWNDDGTPNFSVPLPNKKFA